MTFLEQLENQCWFAWVMGYRHITESQDGSMYGHYLGAKMKTPLPDFYYSADAREMLMESIAEQFDCEDIGVDFETYLHKGNWYCVIEIEHDPPDGDKDEFYSGAWGCPGRAFLDAALQATRARSQVV